MNLGSPLSQGDPGEFGLIVAAQVSELWWALIVRELRTAQEQLRADNLTEASRSLRRAVTHFEPLNATLRSIAWMTPNRLFVLLSRVSAQLGQDTAFQGPIHRQLIDLLGLQQVDQLQPAPSRSRRRERPSPALAAEPSLYDDVLAYLSRIGLTVPAHLLERTAGTPYVPNETIEQIWREIYEDPYPDVPLQQLGDTLAEIANAFTDWTGRLRKTTRRAFTGRSPVAKGGETSAPTFDELPFPDLWLARGFIGSAPEAHPLPA
ncbi:tryptophan 2,3-dioxygenase family protein [Variovorax sp. J22R115]|uniref:tryptophan 2,3-dioxygenase family protein n=1 Tax=Variovorax sp. J22R115 TaxID=3053509 RepID=UPI002577C4D4|nr:tryptophan 2,3-dioxygenase family protein [Variovorax sp. J22R115]MDM0049876.1 tryptophan 2,3-dioxygenase family protein [Variovorax sp. J22R115]